MAEKVVKTVYKKGKPAYAITSSGKRIKTSKDLTGKSVSTAKVRRAPKLYTSRVPTGGGSKEYLVSGNWTTKKPSSGRSKTIIVEQPKPIISQDITFKPQSKLESRIATVKPKTDTTKAFQQLTRIKLKTRDQQITNKIITGQTITPQEKLRYNKLLLENKDKLERRQLELLKSAPKDIATGLYEVGKELVLLPVKAVRGSYNYGKSLRTRYERGENNPLTKDIIKLGKGTVSVAKFVKNNPKESVAIVGLYASVVGRSLEKEFIKNPIKTTTKAVAYLFTGTVIKGGVGVVKIGAKGVTSVAQAKRLATLSKSINAAKQGALTTAQSVKLNKAVVGASKIGNKAKRTNKVKTALKGILKDRGIKPKRGANLQQLSNQVKSSKVQTLKIIAKKVKPKKVKKAKPITLSQLKKAKLEVGGVKEITKVKKGRKTITRYKVTKKGTLKKITKKEFDKLKPKKKKVKKVIKKKVLPKKAKKLDVTKLQAKALKKALKKQGVVKVGKKTYIDINAVKRLENSKAPVKVVPKSKWGKKGQVKFSGQVQTRVQQQVREVSKVKKIVKSIKKGKKIPSKKLAKAKNQLRNLRNKLNKTKNFIKSNKGIIIRGTAMLVIIDKAIKDISAVDKGLGTLPKQILNQKPKQVPIRKPIQKPRQKPKQEPIKDFVKDIGQKPKTIPKLKTLLKKVPRKPKPIKTKPPRKPKKKKLPKVKLGKRKKKVTKKGAIIYTPTGKKRPVTIKTGLPINRARKVAKLGLDNSILGSVGVKAYGKTTKKDIKDTKSTKNRRKRGKKARVQKIVEKKGFRLDTAGEKKGIKFAKAVKSAIKKEKAKLKKAPKKAKKTIKKKVAPKKIKKVKKVSKKALKKVIKKAIKKKPIKKKLSKATKKKIIKKLKKVVKKKKVENALRVLKKKKSKR